MARDARNRAPAQALAPPPVQRHPPILLPGRSRGDRHLADRSRARRWQARAPLPGADPGGQRAGEPETVAHGAQARHWRRQDHRHGHAHRVADGERRSPPREPALHARLSSRRARNHHPGPPAGAQAERPPTATTPAAKSCPRTCCERSTRRRSSSRTTTPFNGGRQ